MDTCEKCQSIQDYTEAQPLLDEVLKFYALGRGMYGVPKTWYQGLLQYFYTYPYEAEYLIRLVGQIYKYYDYESTYLTISLDYEGSVQHWGIDVKIKHNLPYLEARRRLHLMDKTYYTSNKWGRMRRRIVLHII